MIYQEKRGTIGENLGGQRPRQQLKNQSTKRPPLEPRKMAGPNSA